MCGILGVVADYALEEPLFDRMLDSMVHRGPDDRGTFHENGVSLGIRRLRVIDPEHGVQPIYNEERSKVIVFNGELYNFKELHEELVILGHLFKTSSDTEVILHSYEEWGPECLYRFNGMFSFAIYDREKRSLFLARDRIGIKPLFYSHHKNIFRFSSELRAFTEDPDFPREVDSRALDCYLSFGQVVSPLSIYKHAFRLPAGHYLEYTGTKYEINQYWDVPIEIENDWNYEDAAEELRYRFKTSVRRRLISDVPLGAFLSGGIDSSCVVGQMAEISDKPVETFSVGFNTRGFDELDYSNAVARKHKTNHRECLLESNPVEIMNSVFDSLDEPLSDTSIIPTYLISEKAREYVTVALSGDGGDELFGGYEQYTADRIASGMEWIPKSLIQRLQQSVNKIPFMDQKKGVINKLKRYSNGLREDKRIRHLRWMIYFSQELKNELYTDEYKKEVGGLDSPCCYVQQYFKRYSVNAMSEVLTGVDLKMWLVDDILTKVDRMSMLNSLEVRVPFLDHELVEFVTRLPNHIRFHKGIKKGLCREAMKDLLPPEVLNRKEKQGFSFPLRIWSQKQLRGSFDLSAISDISLGGRLKKDKVEQIFRSNPASPDNNTLWRWTLLILFKWYDNFVTR